MHLSQHWALGTAELEVKLHLELHVHGDERWPMEVTSNTYFRGARLRACSTGAGRGKGEGGGNYPHIFPTIGRCARQPPYPNSCWVTPPPPPPPPPSTPGLFISPVDWDVVFIWETDQPWIFYWSPRQQSTRKSSTYLTKTKVVRSA